LSNRKSADEKEGEERDLSTDRKRRIQSTVRLHAIEELGQRDLAKGEAEGD
jgi:hypothetical protein